MNQRRRIAVVLVTILCACAILPEVSSASIENGLYVLDSEGLPRSFAACLSALGIDETASFLSPEGRPVDCLEVAATGARIETVDATGHRHSRELVVMGDVVGTGRASLAQVARMANALGGREPLRGAFAKAADLSGSGCLDLADLVCAASRYRVLRSARKHPVSSRKAQMYVVTPDDPVGIEISFLDDAADVPYISSETAAELFSFFYGHAASEPAIQVRDEEGAVIWTRPAGSRARIDFEGGTVSFDDFNAFLALPSTETSLDMVGSSGFDDDGRLRYCERLESSLVRAGRPVCLDVGSYGISLATRNGMGLMPLQTFCDIFLGRFGAQILYNGTDLFVVMQGNLGTLRELYYSVPAAPRSPSLAEYSYNELCLALDSFYGLKEQHGIRSFDQLFASTGLREALRSEDPDAACEALATLCSGYLGDLHSWFVEPSALAGADADIRPQQVSPSVRAMRENRKLYRDARAAAWPDGVRSYEEVGNTAYVTVDEFCLPDEDTDYYRTPPKENAADTIGLVMYAHSRIMRQNSPIQNVVVDLSCNGGGDAQAAAFLAGWLLGGTARLNVNDTFTGSQASMEYGVDVNADGHANEDDALKGVSLYCLISPCSFSCGNLVPACLKDSGKVTLLGKKSGGGACFVWPMGTADGSLLVLSGPMRMSSFSNGSYYDIDKGVEPDMPVSRVENFYDRETLTQFICGLRL